MLTLRTLPILTLAAGLLVAVSAQAQQQLVPAQSSIEFAAKQMGVPMQGHFRKFDAQLSFDPAKPESSRIRFSVDTGSATMGVKENDAELPKADWFNVVKFPKASFQSTAIKPLGGDKYEVAGKLTIKGTTREVVVPATFTPQGDAGVFEGSLTIQRGDFSIGEGAWKAFDVVANDAVIKFRITAAAK